MSYYLPTTAAPSSATSCYVAQHYYPHLFLVPAGIIIGILAFLRRRRSFKKDLFGGRPGLVVPMDFLGIDNDRLAIMCVFGAAAGSILTLMLVKTKGSNPWETAFLGIGTAIELAFLYYPFFGCLASYHRIVGALMGFIYGLIYFVVATMSNANCDSNSNSNATQSSENDILKKITGVPTVFCQLFILGKFIVVLYKEIKASGLSAAQLFSQDDVDASLKVKLTRPWLHEHVKNLVNSRPARQYPRIAFYLRKIYSREKNFKFSTLTLSMVMICFIFVYSFFLALLSLTNKLELLVKQEVENEFKSSSYYHVIDSAIYGLFMALKLANIVGTMFCVVALVRFLDNHKNNMLRMFKGDRSFIPKNISASQFMIGKGLKSHSYQIGYFLWGYFVLLFLLFVVIFCLYLLTFEIIRDWFINYLKGASVLGGVAIFAGLSLPLASFTIFRDYSYSKDVISINNRNVYLLFSYFWFFIGLPMGFFSAISRLLKAMAVGALMLPRIDHSVMPDSFQWTDRGFNAYICNLHVQAAYRNPVLRVFCQILVDEIQDQGRDARTLGVNSVRKWTFSAQARARWFLALTLARNPQLASERKSDVQPMPIHYARTNDVAIEIDQFGSGNTELLRDK